MNKKIWSRIANYSFFLMMFFLPISLLFDNIFLSILLISSFFNVKKQINKYIIFYLAAFFLFVFFNGLATSNITTEAPYLIKLLPIILLPFCIENLESKVKFKGLIFLFIGIIIIQLNAVYGIIDYYYFSEGKKYALRNYSRINDILNFERPYLGFLSALNIIIAYHFFSLSKHRILSRKTKKIN